MSVENASSVGSRLVTDEPMARHTTFRIGGPARIFFEPDGVDSLAEGLKRFRQQGERCYILGGGSNLLVRDEGVDGVVAALRKGAGFREIKVDGPRIVAGAGVMLPKLVKMAADIGLSGLEALTGIPGTLGGAARMNAGGKHGNIGSLIRSVLVMRSDGEIERRPREKLVFGNRESNLKGLVVLELELELKEERPEAVLERTRTIQEEKSRSQPLSEPSAGCVFKNPPGQHAGALIDQAGLKGTIIGGAAVSEKHANFIVNRSGASAADVLRLIDLIRDRVRAAFDVTLDLEVEIW
jgi:UDP-N-acetylmuramate dehydrogenase